MDFPEASIAKHFLSSYISEFKDHYHTESLLSLAACCWVPQLPRGRRRQTNFVPCQRINTTHQLQFFLSFSCAFFSHQSVHLLRHAHTRTHRQLHDIINTLSHIYTHTPVITHAHTPCQQPVLRLSKDTPALKS